MNKEITYRIKQYLEFDTNYAIIINGDYGIGKTHYIKNELFPEILKLKIPKNNKKYKPILISLFGVKSTEEIQNQILFELYPGVNSPSAKIVASLGNSVLKHIGIDFKDFVDNANVSSGSFFNVEKMLICIDDIDRKSSELPLKEVFGFVNNLVENLNANIVLIANEDVLREEIEDASNNYSLIREKVIGVSIEFKTDLSSVFDNIIEKKYIKLNKQYFDFLSRHKQEITHRIDQNKKNLRNLMFFLEHFKIIYNETISRLKKEVKFDEIQEEILMEILNFALPIAIEYKMGRLNTTNLQEIKESYQERAIDIIEIFGEKDKTSKENEIAYIDEFWSKYSREHSTQKFYFESVFQYLTGNSSFEINLLLIELETLYKFENNKIPAREVILDKLRYWECIDLKPLVYRNYTNQLLKSVDKGEFALDQYLTVFHYASRFNNLLGYNLDKLKKRFLIGIRKGIGRYDHIYALNLNLSVNSSNEYPEYLREIAEYCIEINSKIIEEKHNEELKSIFHVFSTDFKTFLEMLYKSDNKFRYIPIFKKFGLNKSWKVIMGLENSQLIDFGFYLEYRYKNIPHIDIYLEKEFLWNLNNKLLESNKRKASSKLRKVAIEFLNKKVENALKHEIKEGKSFTMNEVQNKPQVGRKSNDN